MLKHGLNLTRETAESEPNKPSRGMKSRRGVLVVWYANLAWTDRITVGYPIERPHHLHEVLCIPRELCQSLY
jgi:hypothetical protein